MEVRVKNLKRYFGKTRAVDDISFSFSSGEIVGFVGPNGAGKTTTMKIMCTMDEPTDGDIFIDDTSVVQYPELARRKLGFMPDALPTHRDVSVDDYLDFFARSFGIKNHVRRKVVDDVEEFTNLLGIRDKFLKDLSKGMKQRVSLARAIIHDPHILVLDEPAAGLDPRARIELRELLKALAQQNKAILVSSHILSELAEICDSTVIIEKGKLLRAGRLDSFDTSDLPIKRIYMRSLDPVDEFYRTLLQLPKVQRAKVVGSGVELDLEGTDETISATVANLVGQGCKIVEVRTLKDNLEDIFMNITKGELN
ncbi:putative ABC transporter ATP-binding protein YbhF [Anaerohalosphaera lusitana]|uniref:Putative ABC transporter ATP-binding protein YbhF n=1 Tax=Anaerohalosphaera lusitana TaxID=1936003 RepID=A0A1U9NKJ9_9BACT|nr:ABC transporter ATP-binding protein [Anaerohalosphaera lusitana]AQT68463.1 putative ABC transporter ATP-binding protein YbhF [Anaerohalosphaera lusitana]